MGHEGWRRCKGLDMSEEAEKSQCSWKKVSEKENAKR